ncbi:hypothetical protein FQZ97_980030 [compost metagenome]
MAPAHLGDQPFPERHGLGVGVVHAEQGHAQLYPAEYHVAQGQPEAGDGGVGIEVDIDDVLVLFRRVLRMADAAVRPPAEPIGVFAQPGVVGRALDGEVQGHFQAMGAGGAHQLAEILEAAQLRVQRFVAALLAADGVGAAGIVRPCHQAIVGAFAVGPADGMDRR